MINDWNVVWLFLVALLLMENIIHDKLIKCIVIFLYCLGTTKESKAKLKYFSDEKQELFVF